jgi:hypothetical protein
VGSRVFPGIFVAEQGQDREDGVRGRAEEEVLSLLAAHWATAEIHLIAGEIAVKRAGRRCSRRSRRGAHESLSR